MDTKLECGVDVEGTEDMMVGEIRRGHQSVAAPVLWALPRLLSVTHTPKTHSTHILSTVSCTAFLLPRAPKECK
jgi:hypothetical protein